MRVLSLRVVGKRQFVGLTIHAPRLNPQLENTQQLLGTPVPAGAMNVDSASKDEYWARVVLAGRERVLLSLELMEPPTFELTHAQLGERHAQLAVGQLVRVSASAAELAGERTGDGPTPRVQLTVRWPTAAMVGGVSDHAARLQPTAMDLARAGKVSVQPQQIDASDASRGESAVVAPFGSADAGLKRSWESDDEESGEDDGEEEEGDDDCDDDEANASTKREGGRAHVASAKRRRTEASTTDAFLVCGL